MTQLVTHEPASPPASETPAPAATTRRLWTVAWLACGAALVLRLPVLRDHIDGMLTANAELAEQVSEDRMRTLALNVGLALAVILSLALLLVLQSLGRVLEERVFTPGLQLGKVRAGLFFVIATAATFPASAFCAATGTVTLRGSRWYTMAIVFASLAAPWMYRRYWRSKDPLELLPSL